ncbi:MAG: hypothetical protein D6715_09865 [Calditrichaeota bacterium]|nr:MAG: hypothetical protein D6715_09865 [Calditrichota bacterium]
MDYPGRMSQKVVSRSDPMFTEVCELLELDPEQVDYLIYEDFEDVDYSMYEDFDEAESAEPWQPESRLVEVFFLDGTREEIEIELDSELDEALKRLLG